MGACDIQNPCMSRKLVLSISLTLIMLLTVVVAQTGPAGPPGPPGPPGLPAPCPKPCTGKNCEPDCLVACCYEGGVYRPGLGVKRWTMWKKYFH